MQPPIFGTYTPYAAKKTSGPHAAAVDGVSMQELHGCSAAESKMDSQAESVAVAGAKQEAMRFWTWAVVQAACGAAAGTVLGTNPERDAGRHPPASWGWQAGGGAASGSATGVHSASSRASFWAPASVDASGRASSIASPSLPASWAPVASPPSIATVASIASSAFVASPSTVASTDASVCAARAS